MGLEAWEGGRGLGKCEEVENRWSSEEASRFYQQTLREAAEVAGRSVSKGFELESRRKTFEEFQEFLGLVVGHGKRLETANGLDVVAFVHG